jgi:predicted porin
MKKLLLAMTAILSIGAAQAQSTNVTLYGTLDAGMRYNSNANTAGDAQTKTLSGFQTPTNFGIKGTEDLGGGSTANFQLESGFSLVNGQSTMTGTAGTNVLFDRAAWFGLGNKELGEVRLGRQTNPTMDLATGGIVDPLSFANDASTPTVVSNSTYGVNATRINQALTFIGSNTGYENSRSDGLIKYLKSAGPVGLTLAYAPGGVAGSDNKATYSGSVSYIAGPVKLGIGATQIVDAAGKVLNNNVVGGNYTFDKFTFTAGYYTQRTDAGYVAANQVIGSTYYGPVLGLTTTSGPGTNSDMVNLGIKYQVTPALSSTLAAYRGNYENGAGKTGDLKTYVLFNEYSMSKRTNLYASIDYAKASGDLVSSTAGPNNTGVTVGMRHRF